MYLLDTRKPLQESSTFSLILGSQPIAMKSVKQQSKSGARSFQANKTNGPLNQKEILRAHDLYLCGMSLSKAALRVSSTRQRLHYYFKALGLKTRPLKRTDNIVDYNGKKYTPNGDGYFRKTNGDRELLHRQKWKDLRGPIPEGMEIHHLDEDKANNEIENFVMMSTSDHAKQHGFRNNQYTKKNGFVARKQQICLHCSDEIAPKGQPSYQNARKFCSPRCFYDFRTGKPKKYLGL